MSVRRAGFATSRIEKMSDDVKQLLIANRGTLPKKISPDSNVYIWQITFKKLVGGIKSDNSPNMIDMQFISGYSSLPNKQHSFRGDSLTQLFLHHKLRVESRFEEIYALQEKGYSLSERAFAQATLSNLIGGIGYFYGNSLIKVGYFGGWGCEVVIG